eukprot:scaffold7595_cov267-Pinguiococcus_pyrenoidosus.AAC.10
MPCCVRILCTRQEFNVTICLGCFSLIDDGEYICYNGGNWHVSCFGCICCGKRFGLSGNIYHEGYARKRIEASSSTSSSPALKRLENHRACADPSSTAKAAMSTPTSFARNVALKLGIKEFTLLVGLGRSFGPISRAKEC